MPRSFIDTNIVAYATGAASEYLEPCLAVLAGARAAAEPVVTSAEVLQELLHIHLRRGLADRLTRALALIEGAVNGHVEPLFARDVLRASEMVLSETIGARDRVHLAVMERLRVRDIISTDRAFDAVPGIRRLEPLRFDEWRAEVFG